MMFLVMMVGGLLGFRDRLIAAIPYFSFLFVTGLLFHFVEVSVGLKWLIVPVGEELVKLYIIQRMNLRGTINYVLVSLTVGYLDALLRVGEFEFARDFQIAGSDVERYSYLIFIVLWIISGHLVVGFAYFERFREKRVFVVTPICIHLSINYAWQLLAR